MDDAVAERPAIGLCAARDRPRNAYELGPYFVAGEPNLRITMPARINEFEMRRKFRVRKGARAIEVEALGIFQTRANAVLHCQVVRPVGLRCSRPVDQRQLPQWKLVGRDVLEGFHRASARQRSANKTEAHWLKLPRRNLGRRITRPEAVPVTGDDRKAGDFCVADKVVDLATLHPG